MTMNGNGWDLQTKLFGERAMFQMLTILDERCGFELIERRKQDLKEAS